MKFQSKNLNYDSLKASEVRYRDWLISLFPKTNAPRFLMFYVFTSLFLHIASKFPYYEKIFFTNKIFINASTAYKKRIIHEQQIVNNAIFILGIVGKFPRFLFENIANDC